MKKHLCSIFLSLVFAAVFFVGCGKNDATRAKDVEEFSVQSLTKISFSPLKLTKEQSGMRDGMNVFAYRLFREVREDRNVFVSPLSVSIALSTVSCGASSGTERQINEVLGFEGRSAEEIGAYYSLLMKNMASNDPATSLGIANAIWIDRACTLKKKYIDDCADYFGSKAGTVDFSDPATLKILNDWVKTSTGGLIDGMFDVLPQADVLIANAICFKALWPFKFSRRGNEMTAEVYTYYFENEKFSGIELPYGNGTFAMRIVLPSEGHSLDAVALCLERGYCYPDHNTLRGITEVSLTLPVFSFSYESHLTEAVKSLGVTDAFDPLVADFSKMSDMPLFINDILHKTYVEVDEKGSTAAATSVVGEYLLDDDGPSLPSKVDFKVDRDFIFEIIDRSSGLTVFIGQHKM